MLNVLPLLLVLAGPAEPIRVYVFTAEPTHGFVDEDLTARRDSVADLRLALPKHARGFRLVDSAEVADITLEVAWRGKLTAPPTVTGGVTTVVAGVAVTSTTTTTPTQDNMRVVMKVGDYRQELWGVDPQDPSDQLFWKKQAERVAKAVAKWARDNDAQLRAALQR